MILLLLLVLTRRGGCACVCVHGRLSFPSTSARIHKTPPLQRELQTCASVRRSVRPCACPPSPTLLPPETQSAIPAPLSAFQRSVRPAQETGRASNRSFRNLTKKSDHLVGERPRGLLMSCEIQAQVSEAYVSAGRTVESKRCARSRRFFVLLTTSSTLLNAFHAALFLLRSSGTKSFLMLISRPRYT
ncbi:uncharacterized protein LOC129406992 isoform X4 [Sorex araneus]|uniref:uncharacterized protein LOC129406992 isoform X4 n=1 Tax=Sorex araneus TaxID=42254 RepID=UPI0024340012|nr:uncharacterized protein LOC129406992 isoform X4 [Sorex araneus]